MDFIRRQPTKVRISCHGRRGLYWSADRPRPQRVRRSNGFAIWRIPTLLWLLRTGTVRAPAALQRPPPTAHAGLLRFGFFRRLGLVLLGLLLFLGEQFVAFLEQLIDRVLGDGIRPFLED